MHPTGRALVLRLLALALVLADIGLITASLIQGKASVPRLLRHAVTIVLLGYWALQPYVRAWLAATRPWRAPTVIPSLRGVISSERIVSNASPAGAVEKRDTFLQARVRDDLVVLLGVDGLATILPRQFFATEDDWQGFGSSSSSTS
jgi:hypothetical protein